MFRHGRRAAWLAALFVLGGCALRAPVEFTSPVRSVELRDVPFHAQTEYHCGPAALATVLGAIGEPVPPAELADEVFLPGRKGSLQAEMLAAARARGVLPVRVPATPDALVAALHQGYPVLVLQNLRLRTWPAWHYAVLMGFDAEASRFVLRSGTEPREQVSARAFRRSLELAGNWAVVLARPDQPPSMVTARDWLAAAAPLESTGQVAGARTAYRAATDRWPDEPRAWQALANAEYAQGERLLAARHLRRAVELDGRDPVARNNLAQVLLELGCPVRARRQLDALGEVPARFADAVAGTRAAADAAGQVDAPACAN